MSCIFTAPFKHKGQNLTAKTAVNYVVENTLSKIKEVKDCNGIKRKCEFFQGKYDLENMRIGRDFLDDEFDDEREYYKCIATVSEKGFIIKIEGLHL